MFWRILWKLFRASRGRLAVALVAVASGAAVCTALINLQLDAERKLTREFRALGANVVISPLRTAAGETPLLPASVLDRIAEMRTPRVVAMAPFLYVVARMPSESGERSVILAGTWLDEAVKLAPWWKLENAVIHPPEKFPRCLVGRNAARQLGLSPGGTLELRYSDRSLMLAVANVINGGGADDNQIFASLPDVQKLAGLEGQLGLAQMSVTGSAAEIEAYARHLSAALPGLDVRPVRQLAEAEGRLLGRIRGLILATVILISVLTALCVLATMAALAMERRRDVGLMKAIGGPMARVVRIFRTEAATLGVLGSLIGYPIGLLLSRWIGLRVFGVAISPRPEVFPITVALMLAVALAGAVPLRLLSRIRPGTILRGE